MGKQALITETRELVQLMAPEDPMRPAQIQKLVQLNEELREALNKLEQAQQSVIHRELEDVDNRVDYSVEYCDDNSTGNMNKQRGTSSAKNDVPLVLPSSTPSILRSTIMDVLYADRRRHTPISEGMSKQHQKTKKQKIVRTNSRSSPMSGISDDGSSSPKSGGVPCVVLGGSTSSAAVSFTTALSPSLTEG